MAVPEAIPNTLPAPETTATAVLLLLHVPPVITSLHVVDEPRQTSDAPVIAGITGVVSTVSYAMTPVPQPNELT